MLWWDVTQMTFCLVPSTVLYLCAWPEATLGRKDSTWARGLKATAHHRGKVGQCVRRLSFVKTHNGHDGHGSR